MATDTKDPKDHKAKVPLGLPLNISPEAMAQMAAITPADIQRVAQLWRRRVRNRRMKTLLDSVEIDR